MYNKFNNNVYDGTTRNQYESLCHIIIKNVNEDVENYNDICMKLMRNLGHLSENPKDYVLSSDRCNILFHWLYTFLDKNKITYDIIDKSFETYDSVRLIKGNTNMMCHYHKNNKLFEPTKITLLDIFDNNMNNIQKLLETEREEIKILCRKFVCECLKIYKHMKVSYCLRSSKKSQKHTDTCLKLSLFNSAYNIFHSKFVGIDPKIPSLDNIDSICLDTILPDELKSQLTSDQDEGQVNASRMGMTSALVYPNGTLADSLPLTHETVDSPMKKTITTTIGTVAGASSLLAFLYKFTPAGRLVNPKLRRTTGIINNNFYGDDVNEHNGFNSYNIGYEAI
ncbi:hypothetical protein PVIIG_06026 [Plasmodium vivax India VII]|uniref:VIR protein n=1 Tax=Plasmodium vivax India VII TaxID=1077284 RepID=A0A0J9S3J1_PLAVI|nr:hypothetical protein PVIIG_06026 [Plasmodium vivax India VII]